MLSNLIRLTRSPRLALAALGLIFLSGCNPSDPLSLEGRTPDGTVTMSMVQAAFIGSGSGGTGTLSFRGRTHTFTTVGLGVGGIGASTVQAEGEVYGLTDLAQFPGTYARARAGFALGTMSAGQLWLQNTNGVILHLQASRQGLMLSLGGDAVVITMNQ